MSNMKSTFYVPVDIIFYILPRLPVKTLIRFKSVCKSWYALIEDHNFIKTQQKVQASMDNNPTFSNVLVISYGPVNSKKCRLLHFSEASRMPISAELPYLSNRESCVMVGICNGLACLSLSHDSREFIICNPATGQFRNIPPSFVQKGSFDIAFLGFYLHANNGYEILKIVFGDDRTNAARAELYNMCTDTWRDIEVKFNYDTSYNFWKPLVNPEGVIIDGIFYWKAQNIPNMPDVAYFDMCKHVFNVIIAPCDPFHNHFSLCHIWEEKKKLSMIMWRNSGFELWSLKEDMTWRLVYRICFMNISCNPFQTSSRFKVMGDTRDGKFVVGSWYKRHNLKLSLLDPDAHETKCLIDNVKVKGISKDAYLYTEALTPVNY